MKNGLEFINGRTTASKIQYYAFEIFLLIIYILPAMIARINTDMETGISMLILFAFSYIPMVIDHRILLKMDRTSNTCIAVEKALFQNLYKINLKIDLTEVSNASLFESISRGKHGNSRTWGLRLILKNGREVYPLGRGSSSMYSHWLNLVRKINEFLESNKIVLNIFHSPFTFRIVGIVFSAIYFITIYGLIFSK